jgi:hypothetical protein
MELKFDSIIQMAEGSERTAAIAQWVQSLYQEGDVPVLVGGSAVELYTGGAYTTGDLDFVGLVPAYVRKALTEAGFMRQGRHWIHEKEKIFLEFPSSNLGDDERKAVITIDRFHVQIISPEDLIVDRLAAFKHWESSVDGINSFLLYRIQQDHLDDKHLEKRAKDENVSVALQAVRSLYREYPDEMPPDKVLEKWLRKFK